MSISLPFISSIYFYWLLSCNVSEKKKKFCMTHPQFHCSRKKIFFFRKFFVLKNISYIHLKFFFSVIARVCLSLSLSRFFHLFTTTCFCHAMFPKKKILEDLYESSPILLDTPLKDFFSKI